MRGPQAKNPELKGFRGSQTRVAHYGCLDNLWISHRASEEGLPDERSRFPERACLASEVLTDGFSCRQSTH